MLFTDYLDSVENTDQEARFFEELAKVKDDLAQATSVPIVGKLIRALVALEECGSVEVFKETGHYQCIEGWDISIDLDSGQFSIYPGAEHRKKILMVLALIGAGLFFLWLCRRHCRKRA